MSSIVCEWLCSSKVIIGQAVILRATAPSNGMVAISGNNRTWAVNNFDALKF